MKILTVAVEKGGTGKTTTAAVFAQAAKFRGKKVLAIDLDPQGNLSLALRAKPEEIGSYEFLEGMPIDTVLCHSQQGVDVIPASRALSVATSTAGSARRLQKALQPVKDQYDLIVIDTPPTTGELQYNALQAATNLIIPLEADIYNLQSLYQIADTAKQIKTSNPDLYIDGLLFTKFADRASLVKQMRQTIEAQAEELCIPCLGTVRNGIAIKEAAALQVSLFEYAPNSKPAQDYLYLYDTVYD